MSDEEYMDPEYGEQAVELWIEWATEKIAKLKEELRITRGQVTTAEEMAVDVAMRAADLREELSDLKAAVRWMDDFRLPHGVSHHCEDVFRTTGNTERPLWATDEDKQHARTLLEVLEK